MFHNITQIVAKQVIFLMIPNEKGREAKSKGRQANIREQWHYLVVKNLSALLRGVTFKHYVDFYFLNCLYSFRTKNKLESRKKVFENKHFCNVIMHSKDTEILEFNQYKKSDKARFIIYADLEYTTEKTEDVKIILKIHLQQK